MTEWKKWHDEQKRQKPEGKNHRETFNKETITENDLRDFNLHVYTFSTSSWDSIFTGFSFLVWSSVFRSAAVASSTTFAQKVWNNCLIWSSNVDPENLWIRR